MDYQEFKKGQIMGVITSLNVVYSYMFENQLLGDEKIENILDALREKQIFLENELLKNGK
ncbi:MAG: hypothetical protein FWC41_11615 [Firmicutes bacterium]|nr:hypothetical protein [Bacillota bacterium]